VESGWLRWKAGPRPEFIVQSRAAAFHMAVKERRRSLMIIGRQHTHGTAFHGAHAAMFELLLQRDVEVEQLLSSSVANAREQDVRSDQRLGYATHVEEKKSRLGVMRFNRFSFEH
jgi:hypothetical protein